MRRDKLLLAGLLDKLAELLDEKLEHKPDEDRTDREIKGVCRRISENMERIFQIKTPIGQQREISGMA